MHCLFGSKIFGITSLIFLTIYKKSYTHLDSSLQISKMNIQDTIKDIHRLRFKEGMKLEDIARIYDKSIYWVNSRLNKKYEPKKVRNTAKDVSSFVDEDIDDKNLSEEVSKIKSLRREGLSYEEIASQLNRSIYWVHSRLQQKYLPKGSRSEKIFQEERVVPHLFELGYTGILQYVRSSKSGINQEADIVATYQNNQHIIEVKVQLSHHQLQTAIGQLIIHKFTYGNHAKLQIALPEEVATDKLTNDLKEHLEKSVGINFLIIP